MGNFCSHVFHENPGHIEIPQNGTERGKLGFEPTKFRIDWRLTKQEMFTLLRQCAAVVFCWAVIPHG